MIACRHVLLACALALILLPAAQAQTRKSVGSWSVVCSGGAAGYCSASNRIKSVSGPYRFQLNVSRERPGAALEVALLTGYQHPGEGSDIAVQVDAGKPLRLAAGSGFRRAGRSNTYVVAAEDAERLLQQMRAGQRVRFRFDDAKGATVDATFALSGLSAAMAFMDRMQPAPRVRAPAASTPAAAEPEPPIPGESKPAPAPATATAPAPSTATPERATRTATPTAPVEKAPVPASPVAIAPTGATLTTPTPSTSAPERASARTPKPVPDAKAPAAALPGAPATTGRQASPAPVAAPTTAPPPGDAASPPAIIPSVAREVTATSGAPVAASTGAVVASAPATAAAATGGTSTAAPMQAKPVPSPAAEVAAVPAKPLAEARRKPARAQQQTAATAAPSTSRKRGAKSFRQFSCVGSEPLWTLVIDGDKARYAALTDSGQRDTVELVGKLNVTGDGPTPIVDWRGKSDWGGSFRAVVSEEACQERISNAEGQPAFEFRAQLTLPGRKTVRGCCYAGLPPAAAAVTEAAPTDTTQYPVADLRNRPESDWSRYLFDLLPAIQACIDKTPEPGPYATKAWPMNRGMVGVRTRNGQGNWFECVADASGKSIDRFVPLPSAAPKAPNEDHVVFSPPDHPPIAGSCYKHERVMDGMGDFMGWLSTDGCS